MGISVVNKRVRVQRSSDFVRLISASLKLRSCQSYFNVMLAVFLILSRKGYKVFQNYGKMLEVLKDAFQLLKSGNVFKFGNHELLFIYAYVCRLFAEVYFVLDFCTKLVPVAFCGSSIKVKSYHF